MHMQGWGNILNLSVLLFFLAVQGQTGPDYSFRALSVTWRMQYALGLLPIMYMLAYRIFYLKESTVWQVPTQARCHVAPCPNAPLGRSPSWPGTLKSNPWKTAAEFTLLPSHL